MMNAVRSIVAGVLCLATGAVVAGDYEERQIGGDKLLIFEQPGQYSFTPSAARARVLVVGGGGAGGTTIGGGGAGGAVIDQEVRFTPGHEYVITVGEGGQLRCGSTLVGVAAGNWLAGGNGGASSIVGDGVSLVAGGGGGGGGWCDNDINERKGQVGVNGGGGSHQYSGALSSGGGHDGGNANNECPGGGAGADGNGENGQSSRAGNGGPGVDSDITGELVNYGAGGGGGGGNSSATPGNAGGDSAGAGAAKNASVVGESGKDGRGGGGGGGGYNSPTAGGVGGCGCVIIRMTLDATALFVGGVPTEYGEPEPAYGVFSNIPSGESFTATAPEKWTREDGQFWVDCTGWRLEQMDGTVKSGSGNTAEFDDPSVLGGAVLTWLWREHAPFAVTSVAVGDSTFGQTDLEVSLAGIGLEASSATVTVRYGTVSTCLSETAEVTVDRLGLVKVPLTGLQAGRTYYASVSVRTDRADTYAGEILSFVQPKVLERGGTRDLPAGYIPLTKLTSTGKEYIVTDIVPDAKTGYEVSFGEVVYKEGTAFFGQSWSGSRSLFNMQSQKFYWHGSGKTLLPITSNTDPDTDFLLTVVPTSNNNGDVTVTNLKTGESATVSDSLSATTEKLGVFGTYTGGNLAPYSLYSLKVTKDGMTVAHFVPARAVRSGGVGLFDMVSSTFYESRSATPFADQPVFESCLPLAKVGTSLELELPDGSAGRTVTLYGAKTYGAEDRAKWTQLDTKSATDAAGTVSFALPEGWGETVTFVRACVTDGDDAVWSKTVLYSNPDIPNVSLAQADGSGGDTLVLRGEVESFAGGECALKVLVGTSPDDLGVVWTGLSGSTLTQPGAFELTLHESDRASARYLRAGSTVYAVIEATANGMVSRTETVSVAMKGTPAIGTVSSSVSRRAVTFTGALTDCGACNTAVVTLWAGEGTNPAAFEQVGDPQTVADLRKFTFNWTFPQFEHDYGWEFRVESTTAGGTESWTVGSGAKTIHTIDNSTYTWVATGTADWCDAASWTANTGDDRMPWPQSTSATVQFGAGQTAQIRLTRPISVGTINANVADLDLTFFSEAENPADAKLSIYYLNVNAAGGVVALSNAAFNVTADVSIGAGRRFVVDAGSDFYEAYNFHSCESGTFEVRGDSTASVNDLRIGGGNVDEGGVVIDDSSLTVRGWTYLGYSKKGGSIRFEGRHPQLNHAITNARLFSNLADAGTHLDFLVPAGGYETAPITAPAAVTASLGVQGSSAIVVNVLPESPVARVSDTTETALIDWQGGISLDLILLGTLPTEGFERSFAWAGDKAGSPTSLLANFIGSAHGDRFEVVSSTVADLSTTNVSPAYGTTDGLEVGQKIVCTAPYETQTVSNDVRVTCTGWKTYRVDPTTYERTFEESGSGTAYEYVHDGSWHQLEWQCEVEYLVTMTEVAGALAVTNRQWVVSGESVTLTAEPLDGCSFYKWSGDVAPENIKDNPLTLQVNGPLSVTAALFGAGEPRFQSMLTVTGYAGETVLVDFPVLVRISPERIGGFRYADCAEGGADISFTSTDGEPYPFEIDTWNPDGESCIWVRLPTLAGRATQFLFRWNDARPCPNEPVETWSQDYGMVWHMDEPDGACANSTKLGSAFDAQPVGDTSQSVAYDYGVVGKARTIKTVGDNSTLSYLKVPDYSSLRYGDTFTASCWVREVDALSRVMAAKKNYNDTKGWFLETGSYYTMMVCSKDGSRFSTSSPYRMEWTQVVLVYAGSTVSVYANGKLLASSSSMTPVEDGNLGMAFGNDLNGNCRQRARFDEGRLMGVAVSADWVAADYATVTESDFVTASPAMAVNMIRVEGEPQEFGSVSPAYGIHDDVADGGTYLFTASDDGAFADGAGTVPVVCTGWKLLDLASGEVVRTSAGEGETATECSVDYRAGHPLRLVWHWQPRAGGGYTSDITVEGLAEEAGTLADFPLLVRVSPALILGFSYTQTAADGSDIAFLDADGDPLDFELDTWNPNGESSFWVRIPEMKKGTTFKMTWKTDYQTPVSARKVWKKAYASVLHMGEPSGACANSSVWGALYDGLVAGSSEEPGSVAEAVIGAGHATVPNKAYLRIEDLTSAVRPDHFTLSSWVWLNASGGMRLFCDKSSYGDADGWEIEGSATSETFRGSSSGAGFSATLPSSRQNVWTHMAYVCDGDQGYIYMNGSLVKSGTFSPTMVASRKPLALGAITTSNQVQMNGAYDEFRFMDGAASADWLKAEFEQTQDGYLSYSAAVMDSGVITVSSCGPEYGKVTPTYGSDEAPVPGQTYVFACPVDEDYADAAMLEKWVCTGWKLYDMQTGEVIRSSAGQGEEKLRFELTYQAGQSLGVEWQWHTVYDAFGGTYAIDLTVDGYHGEETLADFPVLVRVSEARYPHFSYRDCAADGHDVRFRLADGTELASELYQWEPAGESLFWVSLPAVTNGTAFQMTYGNPSLTDFPASQTDGSVWKKAKYLVVWRADGTLRNEVTGTGGSYPSGSIAETDGILGGSYRTDNKYLRLTFASDGPTSPDGVSLSCWWRQKEGGVMSDIVSAKQDPRYAGFDIRRLNATTLNVRGDVQTGGVDVPFEPESLKWYHLAASACTNAANANFDAVVTVNGAVAASGMLPSVTPSSTLSVNKWGGSDAWDGSSMASYDEVRYRDAPSSADWFAAEYATVDDDGFLSGSVRSLVGFKVSCSLTNEKQQLFGGTFGLSAAAFGLDDGVTVADCVWTITDQDGGVTRLTGMNPSITPTLPGPYDIFLAITNSVGKAAYYRLDRAFYLYPLTNYVTAAENPNARAPYDTWERAATSLDAAMGYALDGGTVVLDAGEHKYVTTTTISNAVRVVGLGGPSGTVINVKRSSGNAIILQNREALVESLCISNRDFNLTAVVVTGDGGTVSNVWVTDDGKNPGSYWWAAHYGAAFRCESENGRITHCMATGIDYAARDGSGVYLTAGVCENSLFTDIIGVNGGGAYVGAKGVLRNCTFVGNRATQSGGGVYVVKGAQVVNCIVAGNFADNDMGAGRPEWGAAGDVVLEEAFVNCCFGPDVPAGTDPISYDPAFDTSDEATEPYHLSSASKCVNAGLDYDGMEATDLAGFTRHSGKRVDVGCYEYDSSTLQVGVAASVPAALMGATIVFEAGFIGGDPLDSYRYAWTFRNAAGETVDELETATNVCSRVFADAGRFTVTVKVTDALDPELLLESLPTAVKLVPEVSYVAETNPDAAFPFNTPATAATNVFDVLADIQDNCRVIFLPGTHLVGEEVKLLKKVVFTGRDGYAETLLKASYDRMPRILQINHREAVVEGLTITGAFGGDGVFGAGVYIGKAGGTLRNCRVTENQTWMGASGSGVFIESADGHVTRCVIDNNWNGRNYAGGPSGVSMSAGTVDNCIIVSNGVDATYVSYGMAGGVYCGGGTVSNCTIVANRGRSYGGTQVEGSGRIVNSIIAGNWTNSYLAASTGTPDWGGSSNNYVNCLFSEGTVPANATCRAGDPLFKDAANLDFHLTRQSPAVNGGAKGSWSADAVDFDGNPRVHNFGRKSGIADIGCYETPWGTPGTLLIVR